MSRQRFFDAPRFRGLIRAAGLDAVVALSPANVTYTAGFYNWDLQQIPDRLHLTVWPADGEPCLVAPEFRAGAATFLPEFRGYARWDPNPMDTVADVLRDRGLAGARIGVEKRFLPAGYEQVLRARLPDARFDDAGGVFNLARAVKTPGELEHLRRANDATVGAIRDTFAAAHPGMTERLLYETLVAALLRRGADSVPFAVVAIGESATGGHPAPGDRALAPGDVLWIDAGGLFDGYYTDLARGAVVGQARGEEADQYRRLGEIQLRLAELMRPGVPGTEFYRGAVAAYAAVGLPFRWGILAHAVGLGLHDHPQCSPIETMTLEAGMALCLEPGYREPGRYAFSVEDVFVVAPGGGRPLHDRAGSDALFVIR